jgi:hypothetical protein
MFPAGNFPVRRRLVDDDEASGGTTDSRLDCIDYFSSSEASESILAEAMSASEDCEEFVSGITALQRIEKERIFHQETEKAMDEDLGKTGHNPFSIAARRVTDDPLGYFRSRSMPVTGEQMVQLFVSFV